MTCTKSGCTRKAKFFRPNTQMAYCTSCYRTHRIYLRRKFGHPGVNRVPEKGHPMHEKWERIPKKLQGD